MNMLKVGEWYFNTEKIARIREYENKTMNIWFEGEGDSISLDQAESETVRDWLRDQDGLGLKDFS